MADMSFLREDVHRESGRNRTYYRGMNGGAPMVNGGQPLRPLTFRSVRDELVDGNARQDRLMQKLMRAYEGIEHGGASFREPALKKRAPRPLKLPGMHQTAQPQGRRLKVKRKVKKSKTANSRMARATTRRQAQGASELGRDRPSRGSTPGSTGRSAGSPSGPSTIAARRNEAVEQRRSQSAPLWAPKRNNLAEIKKEKARIRRKLNTKPKLTGADRTLRALVKESDGMRVCLSKVGPKGRGITLFVLLTEDTQLTCIAADNTRALKYRLAMKADPALKDQGLTEKMHVLHAVAVAVRIAEVPKEEQKKLRATLKKTLPGDGWGADLRLELDAEIMVQQMNRPKNLNPQAEIDELNEAAEEEAKIRAREANKAIKIRRELEAERIRKIDEAIRAGKRPALNDDDDDDDFETDEDDDDDEYDEDEDEGANQFNKKFNEKKEVVPEKTSKGEKQAGTTRKKKPQLQRHKLPKRRTDGSEGHPEPLRFRPTDIRIQEWRELDDHPMLVTALYRPQTAEVIVEARDPKLDYQYRLTFLTKPKEEVVARKTVDDPKEVEQILGMLKGLIPQLKISGVTASHLGRMTLG